MPLIDVVVPVGQVTCLHARPRQLVPPPPPQALGTLPPPHVAGAVQLPQLVVRPPQPSGCGPHVPGKSVHVFFVHAGAPPPHTLGVPPAPQLAGAVHVPQLAVSPPQPSETG